MFTLNQNRKKLKQFALKPFLSTILLFCFFQNSIAQDFWEIVNTPDEVSIVSIESDGFGYIYMGTGGVSDENKGLYRSDNKGENWELFAFDGAGAGGIEINELGYIYVRADQAIRRSVDEGETWEAIFDELNGGRIMESYPGGLMFSTGSTGSQNYVIRSTDYGDNWDEVIYFSSGCTETPIAIVIQNPDTIYLGVVNYQGEEVGVFKSIDGGDNWEHIGLNGHYISSLCMNSNGDLFAGSRGHYSLAQGGVYMLPKGQSEWLCLSDNELVTSMSINSQDHIYIGCSTLDGLYGGVQVSKDNGLSWEQISKDNMYSGNIEDLMMDLDDFVYAVEIYSPTPLYKSEDSTITQLKQPHYFNEINTHCYPNPFKNTTNLIADIKESGLLDIKISDINGKEIKLLKLQLDAGKNTIPINMSNYPPGLYFYSIYLNNEYIGSGKMLQMK